MMSRRAAKIPRSATAYRIARADSLSADTPLQKIVPGVSRFRIGVKTAVRLGATKALRR